MNELVGFLMARIADDEATIPFLECQCGEGVSEVDPLPGCPDRITADCESKRQIVEEVIETFDMNRPPNPTNSESVWLGEAVLKALALPYQEHADFREEWRA